MLMLKRVYFNWPLTCEYSKKRNECSLITSKVSGMSPRNENEAGKNDMRDKCRRSRFESALVGSFLGKFMKIRDSKRLQCPWATKLLCRSNLKSLLSIEKFLKNLKLSES